MAVLVLAEHNRVELSPAVASVVAAAKQINDVVDILLLAENGGAVAEKAAKLDGVRKVLLAEAPYYNEMIAENAAAKVLELAADYTHFLFIANPEGKAIAPRVAAKLDVAQISEIIEVVDANTFKRPIYAGSVIETVKALDDKIVVTVRSTAFDPVAQANSAEVLRIQPAAATDKVGFVSKEQVKSDRPELQSAKRVLAGGRGLVDEAEFEKMAHLADKLGAAVGTTRAVVDAGIAPNDWQIGQTGKIIAPELYIGFGISGAIQHIAGIKDAKVIVAVNKDPEAPIFEVADYGLVADAMETIQELENKL